MESKLLIRKGLRWGILLGLLLAIPAGMRVEAQPSNSAQIQAALRNFLATPHTWTGAQTFSGTQTFTGVIRLPDGTAAAPALSWTSDTALGFRRTGSATAYFANNASALVMGFGPTGNFAMSIAAGGANAGIIAGASTILSWTVGSEQNARDTGISRISANLLGIGNATQGDFSGGLKFATLQIPNGAAAEYATIAWVSNFMNVGPITNGGTDRSLRMIAGGTTGAVLLNTNGTDRWFVSAAAGNLTNTSTGFFSAATNLAFSPTAPTVSSGFGTSPSVPTNNGTQSFTINVGTGGVATSGVIGLPTATNGWVVKCEDLTTQSATVFVQKQTATATNTATIGNFNTAGAAAAWVASDILHCTAVGR